MKVLARHLGFPLLALSGLVSCSGEPGTYEECLLELAHDQTADDARSLCREIFPYPRTVLPASTDPPPFWVGSFYYRSSPACRPIRFSSGQFSSGGRVIGGTGLCGVGSKIECDGDGPCLLACVERFGSDETGVFEIREMAPTDTVHGSAVVLVDVEPSILLPVSDWNYVSVRQARNREDLGQAWHLYEQLTMCEQKND